MMVTRSYAALLLVLVSAACFSNEATEFPPGLEPLEENRATLPEDESLDIVTGEDGYQWAHARGRISAPTAVVWAALKSTENVVNTWATDRQSVEENVEPEYEFSFRVSYAVEQVITVEWDELWRYGTILGSPEQPELAVVRYQKVFGASVISLLEGSVTIKKLSAGETEVEFIQHVDALMASSSDIATTFENTYQNLLDASMPLRGL